MVGYSKIILVTFLIFLSVNLSFAEYFCNEMDHFSFEGECKMKEQNNSETVNKEQEKYELWCDPQMDPNTGQISCKMPPKVVLDLLENPSQENAKKYYEWNNKRIERIIAAQKAIESLTTNQDTNKISIKDIQKVEFYFSTQCPHCLKQAFVIKKIAKLIPDKIEGYMVSGDTVSLAKFLQETGLKIVIKPFDVNIAKKRSITAVPITYLIFKDGQEKQIIGYTEKFGILEIDK